MHIINHLKAIDELPLPTSIKSLLLQHLTEPFNHDINATQRFWNDYPTQLIYLEIADTSQSIASTDTANPILLTKMFLEPEFVIEIGELGVRYLLALSITSDDGAGIYTLISADNQNFPITELLSHID